MAVSVEIELKDGTTAYVQFASGAGTSGDPYVVSANAAALVAIQAAVEILDNMISGSEGQVDVVTSALPSGAATEATVDAIKTAAELIDNTIAGSEMQVDVVAPLPAGTNAIGKLAANSGVDIGDVDITSISAGETHLGQVGGEETIIEVTMTPDTSILADGDVLADTQVVAACMRINDAMGILQSIAVIDEAAQAGILDIVFLSANHSLGTENAAVDLLATEAADILWIQNVVAADYNDLVNAQIASFGGLGVAIKPAPGTDDIYVGIISRDTKTYTASSIKLRLGFLQN
jgi:hypothetical protein